MKISPHSSGRLHYLVVASCAFHGFDGDVNMALLTDERDAIAVADRTVLEDVCHMVQTVYRQSDLPTQLLGVAVLAFAAGAPIGPPIYSRQAACAAC